MHINYTHHQTRKRIRPHTRTHKSHTPAHTQSTHPQKYPRINYRVLVRQWSTRGVDTVRSADNITHCRSYHLTSFTTIIVSICVTNASVVYNNQVKHLKVDPCSKQLYILGALSQEDRSSVSC